MQTRNGAILRPVHCQIVTLLSSGLSNREIGNRIGYATNTINKRLGEIFDVYGVRDRGSLLAQFIDPAKVRHSLETLSTTAEAD